MPWQMMQSNDGAACSSTPTTGDLIGPARHLDVVGPNIGHGGARFALDIA